MHNENKNRACIENSQIKEQRHPHILVAILKDTIEFLTYNSHPAVLL